MPLQNNRLKILVTALLLPALLFGLNLEGDISEDVIWKSTDSPINVTGTIEISPEATVTIEPGVTLIFDPGAGIVAAGKIVANGAESDSIYFKAADDQAGWGGIINSVAFEGDLWNGNYEFNNIGTTLNYCVIENAVGDGLFFTSAIGLQFSSIYLNNCTVRSCKGETGMINCGNLSAIMIENCFFESNSATMGGAVGLGVGSEALIRNSVFYGNEAALNGGAIYTTMAEAGIIGNSFLYNNAASLAGAIYAAKSPHFKLHDNVFVGNDADNKAPCLYVTDDVALDIKDNTFGVPRYSIFLEKALNDVDATQNYWGRPDSIDSKSIFYDRRLGLDEPVVEWEPHLWAPIEEIITNPVKVNSIRLCRDDSYTTEIPHGVAEGARMRIRVDAEDSNPLAKDIIRVKVFSAKDDFGIVVPAQETEKNSGVFIGRGEVDTRSDQEEYAIGDEIGGKVTLHAAFYPDTKAVYATMSPKPLAENYQTPEVPDSTHLVNHNPMFTWTYFEVVERPQKRYRFRVFPVGPDGAIIDDAVWDTKEHKSSDHFVKYEGPELEDGKTYVARLELDSGYLWGDPVEIKFRMNSLPTPPVPVEPAEQELAPTLTPMLVIEESHDAEGDELSYDFEVYPIENETDLLQSVQGVEPAENKVSWQTEEGLVENEGCQFRARAVDPFENGNWNEFRQFWINSIEEVPNPFDLSYPENNSTIYALHPEFKWTVAVDPDPLSSVVYKIEIDKSQGFTNPIVYENIAELSYAIPDSLDNRTTYFWRVTAIDNTERTTVSSSTFQFYLDTTPSAPIAVAPLAGEERQPPDKLNWRASSDPDPEDLIFYDVEVFDSLSLDNKIAERFGWQDTAVAVEDLNGWEDLIDNKVYYWRVRSRDNHNADSDFTDAGSFFFNRYNDNPEPIPAITAPADTVMGSAEIGFAWAEASDIDLSDTEATLVYELEATLTDFETGEVRKFESKPGNLELTAPLDDNRLWFYRMRTRDDEGAVSGWSDVKNALVNIAEDPPANFALTAPANGQEIVELDSLLFVWESSSDPDWESSVHYRLEIFPETGNSFSAELEETQYMYRRTLDNEAEYRWIVTAIDNTGLETKAGGEFSFTTNSTPTVPQIAQLQPELMPDGELAFNAASDPNPSDKLTYILEIAADESFAKPVMHIEDYPHNIGVITATIGELAGSDTLIDDKDYFFRVKAIDNHGYQGAFAQPAGFRFNRENDAPDEPGAPFAPSQDIVVNDRSPEVSWSEASDIDMSDPSSSLSYDIRMDLDGELEETKIYQFTTPPGATTYKIPAPLQDNTPWVWQVRTRDDDGAVSGWSPIQSILINVAEDPPSPPSAIKPYPGQMFNVLGPIEFAWSPSADPDYQSSVKYYIEYTTDEKFSASEVIPFTDTTYAMVEGPLKNTTYYWRVTAIDNTGLETKSNPSNFILDTRPTVPQPAMPIAKAELLSDGFVSWNKSNDPNPNDDIIYTVQIGVGDASKAGQGAMKAEKSGISGARIQIAAAGWNAREIVDRFGDNIVCHWRVKAADNHGIVSDWSAPAEFIFNGFNDQPLAVANLATPRDAEEVANVNLSWEPGKDPDPSDTPERISYEVELATDRQFTQDVRTERSLQGVTTVSPRNLIDNTVWYWRVAAIDDEGAIGAKSATQSFVYNVSNDPPKTFRLLEPEKGTVFNASAGPLNITLKWERSIDPDPNDQVKYTVHISRNRDFPAGEMQYPNLDRTEFTPPAADFTESGTYYWRVVAEDAAKSTTCCEKGKTAPWHFDVKLPAPQPEAGGTEQE